MSSSPRAGWYPDHQAPDGHLRYWDGAAWTDERSLVPLPRPPEEGALREWLQRLAAGVVVAAFVVAVALVYQNQQTPAPGPFAGDRGRTPTAGEPAPTDGPSPEGSPTAEDEPPDATPPQSGTGPRTWRVDAVLDAHTLQLSNGAVVRLVGLEAPVAGDCVADAAVEFLTDLVDGQRVALRRPGADKDADGRLLRYVVIGPMDLGLRLLRQGLATAAEPSDTGEEPHPREGTYRRAAAEAPLPACAGEPDPAP